MPSMLKKLMIRVMTRSLPAEEQKAVFDQLELVDAQQDRAGRNRAIVGGSAPDCTLLAVLDGKQVKLTNLQKSGRPLVLNFGSCS